ncbi:polysaccharide biosynthesis protein [Bombilactobacillus folatiphilus]|uniref:Polysaccharide biosynthesis protein n=1 Tax=Bombilactobacillus folatiphilus TaxID=2923362 RepID=A0ABY4P879_9LACO|nr:polysaccharide biosynthesis protein [Bombilactobacillus folatiphilus]UQS81867.1 polysaccharide biosynthesis protein [Bombilactobacillus folatiphilus]
MARSKQQTTTMKKDSLLSGSAWITASGIVSRALSALYIIPWNIWMGSAATVAAANALYGKVYNIYDFFLLVSTAGLPSAISKQIAHYNAMGEYEASNQLFKQALKVTAIIGLVFAAVMYFGAHYVALLFTNGDPRSIPALKALAIAVLLLPTLSIMRGYFQGHGQMGVSAVSMMLEQLARVAYMLLITYIIMQIQHGNYVDAVTKSTFASFIGASISILYLLYVFWRQRHTLTSLAQTGQHNINFTAKDFTKEIVWQAIPFIVIDSAITIFKLFDQATFNPMMQSFMHISHQQLDYYYSLFGFQANKLIMVVVSLATGVVSSAIPIVSSLYTTKDTAKIKTQIVNIIRLFAFFMVPATLGMLAVSRSLWSAFYGYDLLGIRIMQLSCLMALLLGFFMVLAAILQALYRNNLAIKYLVIGFIFKIVIQWPLVYAFHEYGPIVATMVAMALICFLMLRKIHALYPFNLKALLKHDLVKIIVAALLMMIVVLVVDGLFYGLDHHVGRVKAAGYMGVEVLLGAIVYGYYVLKTRLMDQTLDLNATKLRQLFHIK